ncbi:LysR family transcriptional regulator [Paramylibacter ulvae]|nr:LysR family transcriptional regulator [Amylibacter ulvae]
MTMYDLNLRHLRAFCDVAEHGNITQASARVHMSQPAITQAIAKLEDKLEHRLFDRRNAGLFLTTAGELLQNRALRATAHLIAGVDAALSRERRAKSQSFAHSITATQLRALLAVEQAGNYSLAARNIGLTQPSLYRSARDLERVSGIQFFQKTPQGIELTPAAKEMADHTHLMFYELNQAGEDLRNFAGYDGGQVSIGTMPLARSYMLPNAINTLLDERPNSDLRVVDGPYMDLLRGLRLGKLDMLIGALRDDLPVDDVEQHLLFNDPLAIVARAGHPLCDLDTVTPADLAKFPWVVPRNGTPTRHYFNEMMAGVIDLNDLHVIETSSLVLIRGLLTGSDRLTISSAHQIAREEKQGLLSRLNFDLRGIKRQIGLTTRVDWQPTKTQKRMWDLLQSEGAKSASQTYTLLHK